MISSDALRSTVRATMVRSFSSPSSVWDLRRHDCLAGLPLPEGLAVVLILCIIFARHRAERDGLGVGDRAARTDVQAVGQSLKNRLRLAWARRLSATTLST